MKLHFVFYSRRGFRRDVLFVFSIIAFHILFMSGKINSPVAVVNMCCYSSNQFARHLSAVYFQSSNSNNMLCVLDSCIRIHTLCGHSNVHLHRICQ